MIINKLGSVILNSNLDVNAKVIKFKLHCTEKRDWLCGMHNQSLFDVTLLRITL